MHRPHPLWNGPKQYVECPTSVSLKSFGFLLLVLWLFIAVFVLLPSLGSKSNITVRALVAFSFLLCPSSDASDSCRLKFVMALC